MKVTNFEACDYSAHPPGGQLSFCRIMVEQGLVGHAFGADANAITGVEHERVTAAGNRFKFTSLYSLSGKRRPNIPVRIQTLYNIIRRGRRYIVASEDSVLFVHSPESVLGVSLCGGLGFARKVYISHGATNPIVRSRYPWARCLAGLYNLLLSRAIREFDLVLVAAGDDEVQQLSQTVFAKVAVKQFPMPYDDTTFRPMKAGANEHIELVVVGRINAVKGWKFLVDVIAELSIRPLGSICNLTFVGDGEDRERMLSYADQRNVSSMIKVTGFLKPSEVAGAISRADLALVGSFEEGWPISVAETLACGRNVVSTNVSGARDMIKNGVTGYVAVSRDVVDFAELVLAALSSLPRDNHIAATSVSYLGASRLGERVRAVLAELC